MPILPKKGCFRVFFGADLAQSIWGALPHQPFITETIFPFSETEKIQLHIGPHLKSVISRVANFVMGYTLRPVEVTPEGPRARWGS